ncbi:DUF3891 family protein [Geomicrobium sp. JCM 19039]|nr:DUF3891 family protein [Geomicrobium sp. JCM 19039]
MIIREESEFWVVTTQHEHGGLSGHLPVVGAIQIEGNKASGNRL